MRVIAQARYAIQYTGTNGADVAAFLNIARLVSDTESVLTIDVPDYGELQMEVGQWLVKSKAESRETYNGILSDADYRERYVEIV
jgi:hypothetical protein